MPLSSHQSGKNRFGGRIHTWIDRGKEVTKLLNTENASTDEATTGASGGGDAANADTTSNGAASNVPLNETVNAAVTPTPTGPLDNAEAAVREVRERPQPELNDALAPAASDTNADDQPRREVADGRPYEIIYIVRVGDADAAERTTDRLRAQIESNGGAIDNVRVSETRRLAYPIKKQIEGIYVVVNARFNASVITELDRFFKLEESVLRHMIQKQEAV
jgi:small subunit ribosomal protein S6